MTEQMNEYKALVQYLDRKANCLRKVWMNVKAPTLAAARTEVRMSFTTFEVIEAKVAGDL